MSSWALPRHQRERLREHIEGDSEETTREIQTRSTWQSRCVLRGCVGVGVMRHAYHLAQILRAQDKNEVDLLPEELDEKLAELHLPVLGATLTVYTQEQAVYIGVKG